MVSYHQTHKVSNKNSPLYFNRVTTATNPFFTNFYDRNDDDDDDDDDNHVSEILTTKTLPNLSAPATVS